MTMMFGLYVYHTPGPIAVAASLLWRAGGDRSEL